MTLEEALQALIDGKVLKRDWEPSPPTFWKMGNDTFYRKNGGGGWKENPTEASLTWILDGVGQQALSIHQPHTIIIDGKTIELSEESFNELKRKLNEN